MTDAKEKRCEDCARYVPNEEYNPNALLSAKGYCGVPETTWGLLGRVAVGEGLNVVFARSASRCNEGRNWFTPKEVPHAK